MPQLPDSAPPVSATSNPEDSLAPPTASKTGADASEPQRDTHPDPAVGKSIPGISSLTATGRTTAASVEEPGNDQAGGTQSFVANQAREIDDEEPTRLFDGKTHDDLPNNGARPSVPLGDPIAVVAARAPITNDEGHVTPRRHRAEPSLPPAIRPGSGASKIGSSSMLPARQTSGAPPTLALPGLQRLAHYSDGAQAGTGTASPTAIANERRQNASTHSLTPTPTSDSNVPRTLSQSAPAKAPSTTVEFSALIAQRAREAESAVIARQSIAPPATAGGVSGEQGARRNGPPPLPVRRSIAAPASSESVAPSTKKTESLPVAATAAANSPSDVKATRAAAPASTPAGTNVTQAPATSAAGTRSEAVATPTAKSGSPAVSPSVVITIDVPSPAATSLPPASLNPSVANLKIDSPDFRRSRTSIVYIAVSAGACLLLIVGVSALGGRSTPPAKSSQSRVATSHPTAHGISTLDPRALSRAQEAQRIGPGVASVSAAAADKRLVDVPLAREGSPQGTLKEPATVSRHVGASPSPMPRGISATLDPPAAVRPTSTASPPTAASPAATAKRSTPATSTAVSPEAALSGPADERPWNNPGF
jgi:hypothetical protein